MTALTFRPSSAAEVAELVRRARDEGLLLTVVAGGHGPWSHGEAPGMRIELSGLAGIEVDGSAVRIGGGAVWGDVARELAQHGLAISSGDTASVGVGGLTLGGGIGLMVRAWGLAVDQLVGAQVVTAEGEIVEAAADQHADLFWALRGGGGNFGIVTRFDFAAHPLPGIAVAEAAITGDAGRVLRALRDLMSDAPQELTVTYMDVPAMDPSAPAGVTLTAVWAGAEPDRLRAAIAPIADLPGVSCEISTPAYPDRSATWFVMAGGFDVPGLVEETTREGMRRESQAIEARRLAEYGNFADTERPEAIPSMFEPAALSRLREVKAAWDPQNLFRRNHNLVP